MSVHAHPDDEASKGAGTVARYAAEGIRAALVCCTGGEEGEILNPAADTPEVRADLGAVRMAELRASVDAIGYAELYLLGYRDSGMPDTEANARPDNFANAPLDEAVGRLVAIIRREQPQVLVTYGDERAFYEHPDHIRVHEISVVAFDAAGDPDRYPDAGAAVAAVEALLLGLLVPAHPALHDAYEQIGEESPYAERIAQFEERCGVGELADHAAHHRSSTSATSSTPVGAALIAHRTQIDPESHWMQVPDDLLRETFPWEEYVLARSLVPGLADAERRRARARPVRRRAGRASRRDHEPSADQEGRRERRRGRAAGSTAGSGGAARPAARGVVQVVVTGLPDGDGVVAGAARRRRGGRGRPPARRRRPTSR